MITKRDKNSLEIYNMESHPHLLSWQNALLGKIKLLDKKMETAQQRADSLSKEKNLDEDKEKKIQKTMTKSMEKVKRSLLNYKKDVDDLVQSILTKQGKDTLKNSSEMFVVYKKLYQRACSFFSRQETAYQKSTLTTTPKTFQEYLYSFFDDESSDSWEDILIPIWSMEGYFNSLVTELNLAKKKSKASTQKLQSLENELAKNQAEKEKLEHELELLREVKKKITPVSNGK